MRNKKGKLFVVSVSLLILFSSYTFSILLYGLTHYLTHSHLVCLSASLFLLILLVILLRTSV